MIEDALTGATSTLNQTVLGSLLVASWVIFALAYREMKKELREERTSHQATREQMVKNLQSQNQLASGLLTLQDSIKAGNEAQAAHFRMLLDTLSSQRRAG